jgi:hypothetical protein
VGRGEDKKNSRERRGWMSEYKKEMNGRTEKPGEERTRKNH